MVISAWGELSRALLRRHPRMGRAVASSTFNAARVCSVSGSLNGSSKQAADGATSVATVRRTIERPFSRCPAVRDKDRGGDAAMSDYWDYSDEFGPNYWPALWPTGHCQSPVDIQTDKTVFKDALVQRPLVFRGDSMAWKVKNTGCGMLYEPVPKRRDVGLSGGPLTNRYVLEQFHFHWGKTNETGSEHTVNGRSYAGELHLVHYNSAYETFADAADKPFGLAVVGVFLAVEDCGNPDLEVFLTDLDQAGYKGSETHIRHLANAYGLLPQSSDAYWTYSGSLTTPPLYESVSWLVCAQPISVAVEQLDTMRRLKAVSEDHVAYGGQAHPMGAGGCYHDALPCIAGNTRPVQPINHRHIEASFPNLERHS